MNWQEGIFGSASDGRYVGYVPSTSVSSPVTPVTQEGIFGSASELQELLAFTKGLPDDTGREEEEDEYGEVRRHVAWCTREGCHVAWCTREGCHVAWCTREGCPVGGEGRARGRAVAGGGVVAVVGRR